MSFALGCDHQFPTLVTAVRLSIHRPYEAKPAPCVQPGSLASMLEFAGPVHSGLIRQERGRRRGFRWVLMGPSRRFGMGGSTSSGGAPLGPVLQPNGAHREAQPPRLFEWAVLLPAASREIERGLLEKLLLIAGVEPNPGPAPCRQPQPVATPSTLHQVAEQAVVPHEQLGASMQQHLTKVQDSLDAPDLVRQCRSAV